MGELIAGRTLAEWKEFARRDDCLDCMVPSDLRLILAAREPAPDLAELVEAATAALHDINDLAANSEGVAGLHMNGDVADWSSLREGGTFGAWLRSVDALAAALAKLGVR